MRAGEALAEPPDLRVTGHDRSANAPLRVVFVHAAEPGTPFLDTVHWAVGQPTSQSRAPRSRAVPSSL